MDARKKALGIMACSVAVAAGLGACSGGADVPDPYQSIGPGTSSGGPTTGGADSGVATDAASSSSGSSSGAQSSSGGSSSGFHGGGDDGGDDGGDHHWHDGGHSDAGTD